MSDIQRRQETEHRSEWIGPTLLLMGGVCIGFAPILLRIGVGDGTSEALGPQGVAYWRYVFAVPILFALNFAINRRLPISPNRFAILAGMFFALDIGLWHWGLTLTTVANATFIVNLGNLLAGLTAWIILKERPTPLWAVAVLVALMGAALLSLGGPADETAQTDLRGDALSFGAAILVSLYVVFAKIARRTMTALDVLFWATLTEAVVGAGLIGATNIIPAMPAESLIPPSWGALFAPFLLAIVVQTMGQGLIILGLGKTPAAVAGVMIVVQPVTSAAIAWHWFNEPLFALQMFGAGLILAGVFIAAKYGAPKPLPAPET